MTISAATIMASASVISGMKRSQQDPHPDGHPMQVCAVNESISACVLSKKVFREERVSDIDVPSRSSIAFSIFFTKTDYMSYK